jgi:hypothetical protein
MPPSSLIIYRQLQDFVAAHPEDRIPVRSLVSYLGEHGLLLILLVFALFCAIPLPIPGIHIFLSMPLFYVTIQQVMGRHTLWLPEKILKQTLPRSGFVTLLEKSGPWFEWLEHYIHHRHAYVTHGVGYRLMGVICLFITCIILIPLPLTNVVPALSIALMSLGMLCHDGYATLAGAFVGLVWCFAWLALAFAIGWAGMTGIYTYIIT